MDHVLELGHSTWVSATKICERSTIEQDILEAVDDFFVSDADDGCTLVEETSHVLAKSFTFRLLDLGQVHASARAPHGTYEVAGELHLEFIPPINGVLLERLKPCEVCFPQTEREVEALCVVVATSIFNG